MKVDLNFVHRIKEAASYDELKKVLVALEKEYKLPLSIETLTQHLSENVKNPGFRIVGENFNGASQLNASAFLANQGADALSSSAEFITNAGDALKDQHILKAGLSFDDPELQTHDMILKKIFSLTNGKYIQKETEAFLKKYGSDLYGIIGSGEKSLSFFDRGIGQSAQEFQRTFMAFAFGNKTSRSATYGVYGTGGHASLRFTPAKMFISRRSPEAYQMDLREGRASSSQFAFSLILELQSPIAGTRPVHVYLVDPTTGLPYTFDADAFDMFPQTFTTATNRNLEHGTFIKVFDYEMPEVSSLLLFKYRQSLSQILPGFLIPGRMFECRPSMCASTKANDVEKIFHCLGRRIQRQSTALRAQSNQGTAFEPGFPVNGAITIDGMTLPIQVLVFKKNRTASYKKTSTAVQLELADQVHGQFTKHEIFSASTRLDFIKNDTLIRVDCTNLRSDWQNKIFYPDRVRVDSASEACTTLRAEIKNFIKRSADIQRIAKARENSITVTKSSIPQALKMMKSLLPKLSASTDFFAAGSEFEALMNATTDTMTAEVPTFFQLKGAYTQQDPKLWSLHSANARIKLKTDVRSDYFMPSRDSTVVGEVEVYVQKRRLDNFSFSMKNGTFNLSISTIEALQGLQRDDERVMSIYIRDTLTKWKIDVPFRVTAQKISVTGGVPKAHGGFQLPELNLVEEKDLASLDMKPSDVIRVLQKTSGLAFYINSSHSALKAAQRQHPKTDQQKVMDVYVALISSWSMLTLFMNDKLPTEEKLSSDSLITFIQLGAQPLAQLVSPTVENALGKKWSQK